MTVSGIYSQPSASGYAEFSDCAESIRLCLTSVDNSGDAVVIAASVVCSAVSTVMLVVVVVVVSVSDASSSADKTVGAIK